MRKSTMIELVQELESIEPKTEIIQAMISEAKAGEYHDFKNNKYTCGKVALVEHCHAAGLEELAKRVMSGEFDESPDQDDIRQMREDAIANGMNERQLSALGLGKEKLQ